MTEKRANEIFRTKYPNGEICAKNTNSAGSKYWVVFDTTKPNSKAYEYCNSSYSELLSRFGFTVLYKHDVKNLENIIKMNKETLSSGIHPYSLFDRPITEEERNKLLKEIENCEYTLATAIKD